MKVFSDDQTFILILMDEMKVQYNLVSDKHTEELNGYVNVGDTELNYVNIEIKLN